MLSPCLAQKSGITAEAFEDLLKQLRKADPSKQLDLVTQAAAANTLTSDQGREILELLPSTFEKVGGILLYNEERTFY